jgi:RNA polymerase sigma-70 factor (sigma-E family)
MSEVAVARTGASPSSEERFDAFVGARGDALWRSAWLLTGDRHLAEDLVQTALAKAWPKWAGIADEGRFEAYLRRTLFTTYVAWWRRKWNGERPTEHPPERSTMGADADRGHDLMVALAALPRMQRAVVVCRWFEDLSEAQTAERLGISTGTVKSHGSRALAALRSSPHLTEERDV